MIDDELGMILDSLKPDNKNMNEDSWTPISTMAGEEYLKHCQEINDRNEMIRKADLVTYIMA